MESSYLNADFFRRFPQEVEKAGNVAGANAAAATNVDSYAEGHFWRIGSNVSSYINMVSETLKNTIPKAVAYCQVKEAKQCLLNHFYKQMGKKKGKQISELSDEDPTLMERRLQCAKRLELTRKNGVKLILYHGLDDDDRVRCMFETVCTIIQLDGLIVESFDS